MRVARRKTAPKVSGGKTLRKNRTSLTPNYWNTVQDRPVVDRQRPGDGFRHLITQKQLYQFIDILPDWDQLSLGLDAILLAPGNHRCYGWHRPGVIAVCAWNLVLEEEWPVDFIEEHHLVFDRLGITCQPIYDEQDQLAPSTQLCKFTETSARGFLLMHILLHELGHHHDRMSTKSQRRSSRGESFAENYANSYANQIWDSYFRIFGW